jgi:formate dehydrogenase subunit gamma
MQLANLIHAAGRHLIPVAFGHIYIGTAGTEGAIEGMTTGRVSVEWAKQQP